MYKRQVNEYIRSDVDGFQEEWLQCRRTDQERSIRDDKKLLNVNKSRTGSRKNVTMQITTPKTKRDVYKRQYVDRQKV